MDSCTNHVNENLEFPSKYVDKNAHTKFSHWNLQWVISNYSKEKSTGTRKLAWPILIIKKLIDISVNLYHLNDDHIN